jgi:hypothetical protein
MTTADPAVTETVVGSLQQQLTPPGPARLTGAAAAASSGGGVAFVESVMGVNLTPELKPTASRQQVLSLSCNSSVAENPLAAAGASTIKSDADGMSRRTSLHDVALQQRGVLDSLESSQIGRSNGIDENDDAQHKIKREEESDLGLPASWSVKTAPARRGTILLGTMLDDSVALEKELSELQIGGYLSKNDDNNGGN